MIPLIYHQSLNLEKWSSFSKMQQVLMVANELNRAQNWISKNENNESNLAYERAFELIYLTVADQKWKSSRKEWLRLKETIGELYTQTKKDIHLNNLCLSLLTSFSTESYNMLQK